MIRAMELSDIVRVAEIHVFGWRSAFRGIVSDEILFGKMTVERSIKRFEEAFHEETEETYVFDDGIIKAFMIIGPCRDEDKPDAFELWGIYVEPLMKGQGIGSKMAEYCEQQAAERGYKEICLWTWENGVDTRRFYEKMGYYIDGKREFVERYGATIVRHCKGI